VVDLLDGRVCRHRRPSGDCYAEHDDVRVGTLRLSSPDVEIDIGGLF